jgi:hypothetical protein
MRSTLILVSVLCLGIGCGGIPFLGGGGLGSERKAARPLVLGEWYKESLHCDDGNCRDWYQIFLSQAGDLRLDVYSPTGSGLPDYTLILEDENERVLEELPPTGKSPRQVRRRLEAGLYRVLLRSRNKDDERLHYEILAEFETPRPRKKSVTRPRPARPEPTKPLPVKPAPEPIVVSAEVLEIEERDGQPSSVLIDAGKPQGVRAGLGGELVEKGKTIARIEVTDVYDAGSRAQILGPLEATITIDTRARIRIPADQ